MNKQAAKGQVIKTFNFKIGNEMIRFTKVIKFEIKGK